MLQCLEAADGNAKLLARLCIVDRRLKARLCDADGQRTDSDAPLVENLHRGLEAPPLPTADHVPRRHAAVREDHVAGVRTTLPHLAVVLAERDSRRARIHDEGRDAASALEAIKWLNFSSFEGQILSVNLFQPDKAVQ